MSKKINPTVQLQEQELQTLLQAILGLNTPSNPLWLKAGDNQTLLNLVSSEIYKINHPETELKNYSKSRLESLRLGLRVITNGQNKIFGLTDRQSAIVYSLLYAALDIEEDTCN